MKRQTVSHGRQRTVVGRAEGDWDGHLGAGLGSVPLVQDPPFWAHVKMLYMFLFHNATVQATFDR